MGRQAAWNNEARAYLGASRLLRPAPADVLIRQGAADRSPLVRRAAAHGLVHTASSSVCAGHLGPAVSGCSELRRQLFCVAASDWINARLLPFRKLDRQQPTLLAQFQRAVKGMPRNRRARCPVHLVASFDRKVWTKESEGTIRRGFVRLIASTHERA